MQLGAKLGQLGAFAAADMAENPHMFAALG
jgi:hypothetical protein